MDSKPNRPKKKRLKSDWVIEIDPRDIKRRPRSPIKPERVEQAAKTYQRKSKHPKRTWFWLGWFSVWAVSQTACQKGPDPQLTPVGREITGPYVWATELRGKKIFHDTWRISPERWQDAWSQTSWRIVERRSNPWSRGTFSIERSGQEGENSFWTFRWVEETVENHVVESEALEFWLPDVTSGSLQWADRKGEWSTLKAAAESGFLPRGIPWWLSWGDRVWAFAQFPAQRAPGLWIQPSGHLTVELDHRLNRPFGSFGSLGLGGGEARLGARKKGDKAVYTWKLYFSQPRPELPPRYPFSARAAVVVTDHADQGSAPKTSVLQKAFESRDLKMTKTVFGQKSAGYWKQLDDPAFESVALELQKLGSEIGLHSWTGHSDTTQHIESGIQKFRRKFNGKTWIDHQPDTNLEALANAGLDPNSPYFSMAAIQRGGFLYVWNAKDLSLGKNPLNLLRPSEPHDRVVVYFQDPALGDLTAFATQWAYWTPKEWDRRFSESNLKTLIQERGLWMGHTYLDTHQDEGPHRDLSLLDRAAGGHYALNPFFSGVLDRWADFQSRGELATTTVDAVLTHWLKQEKSFPVSKPNARITSWMFRSESVD